MTEEQIKEGLSAPFPAEDIEWRLQSCGDKNGKIWGMCLAYVTNRAIMQRLDDVVGVASWKNEFIPAPNGGVMCSISIKINNEWVTKQDGAENTDIEAVKGGLSGAMKRAAVQWGIGRYLYKLEEGFAVVSENGIYRGQTKDKKSFKWNPPQLPAWALPKPVNPLPKKSGAESTQTPTPTQGAVPPSPSPAPPKEEKTTNYKFLETVGKEKERVGEDAYYKVIGNLGYEHANQITDKDTQAKFWKELKALPSLPKYPKSCTKDNVICEHSGYTEQGEVMCRALTDTKCGYAKESK